MTLCSADGGIPDCEEEQMKKDYLILNEERNVSLTAYLQDVGGEFGGITERPAVLIIPGGGYHFCSDREADPVAYPFLKAGYHAFILRYSLNEQAAWPRPLEDYEQAMELIFGKADEWHVARNRIAVIGFSAGGHLAACAATMAKHRPAAAILGYPVIDGTCAQDYLPTAPDVPSAVDGKTCPCFVFATRTDNLVPVMNTVHMIEALCRNDIAFESHIYANGAHGLSTGDVSLNSRDFSSRYPDWVKDSIDWLRDMIGGIDSTGLTSPKFGSKVNGNREETLNLDCTIAYLAAHPEGKRILEEITGRRQGFPPAAAGVITLRDSLAYMGFDAEKTKAVETRLQAIKNN